LTQSSGVTNLFSSGDQNTDGIEFNEDDVDTNSSFDSIINGEGGQADYQLEFTDEVMDVSFNINDVDGDGVVRVLAFDAQGNQIAVDLTGGSSVTLSNTDGVAGNDTANSNGGYQPDTNGDYAVTVSIAGPVARIVIEHSQDGPNNSGINITDVFFDAAVADTGPDGNDSIDGGDGDDLIYGEGGDDTISGGADNDFILAGDGADSVMGDDGDDTLCGQDGDDTLLGGAGNDVLEGMNDNDVLFGGAGDDSLYGDAGTDELTGGEGADLILGGANSDTIFGGAGDVVDGGSGGFNTNPALNTDDDTLDLTGQGPFVLENVTTDGNGNGTNGTVVFVDGAGDPTGETLTFTEIENIIGDDVTNFDPDAVDDSSITDEDTTIIVDLTGNDTDANGDTLTVTAVSVPADQGTIVDNGDGTATFTPADDFNGEATISYSITDGNGGTDSAIHTVMVTPVNDGPDAVNDSSVTDEDTAVTVDLLANDTDLDGDTLTVTGATVPASQGTLVDNGDGTVTFTPVENFNGTATISYSITDGNGGTDTAIHTIEVTPVNDAPVAVDDIAETFEDEAVVIDLIGNDTDADGDPLNIGTVTVPAEQGTVVDNGDGTVTFTPAENYTGPASITYTVQDGQGGEDSGEAVVNVEVIGVNDGPQAVDDAVTTDEDTPITIDVLDNDFDIEGDDLSITAASVPADQGTVEIVGGALVFTPADDFNGEATITYGITDTNGGADIGEVIVTVTPVNDGPVAVDDIETTDEDQPITIDLVGNDTDVDGDLLTVGTVTVPADQGTVVDNGDGTVTFTPADNFNGPATITYTVEDGQGGSDEGQAVVSVGAVNDGPVAGDGADVTDEDTAVTVDLLANDTDLDGDDLTVITATVPADQGTLVDNGDGTVTFTPAENFNGIATISYEISDSNGGTDNAIHTIDVGAVNDGPDAVNDSSVTDEDTAVTVDLLANDTDLDGDTLTVTGATVPASQGTLVDNGDGTVTFTPVENFNGTATISYSITDGNGGTDTAIHTIEVTPVNDAPVAVDDIAETFEDEAVVIDLIGNDTDADGDPLNIGTVTVPAEQGTVVDNGDGTVTFTPAENYTGPASITYTVQDGQGGEDSGEAVVNVEVIGVNDGPQAVDDAVTTDEDTPITIDVLDNDFDIEGDDLSITAASVPADQGTVEIVGGALVFTPADDFNGEATITYGITDTNGGADIGEVIVTVTPVNDGPVAVDDIETTDEDQPITIDLVGNDTDVDGDLLTVGTVTVPADQGTVVDNGDGTVTFTPADNFNGPATITYTVEDGQGGSDEGQAVVSVGAVNDGPVAGDGADVTDEDTAVTVDLLANDTDLDGDDLTVITATVPADQGTLVDNGDGTVTFTPAENFNGIATISYEISDGNGGTDTAVHAIEVVPVNDDPNAEDDAEISDEDVTITVDLLENDTDVDGHPLTVTSATVDPSQGTLVDNGDGTVTFTPVEHFNGEATISYEISDDNGGSDAAVHTITINAVDDAPEATDDTDTTPFETPVTIDVLDNDTDPDGDALTITVASVPTAQGTVAIVGNQLVFTPADGFEGTATISYTISDGVLEDTAEVTVIVEDEPLDGIVSGTDAGELIDENYIGDPQGDMVDNGDNVFSTDPAEEDDDQIVAGGGNDTILAGEGDDLIFGGEGDDQVNGGTGDDTISGGSGDDTIAGAAGDDRIVGGIGDDSITGGGDDDTLTGDEGNDTLNGSSGDDSVDGGAGDDSILGGLGSDTVDGGAGDDVIDTGNGDISVDMGYPGITTDDTDPEDDRDFVDGGIGNDTITTGDDRDTIIGGDGDDVIDGGIDDDVITGDDGADRIVGGEGNDDIEGGIGNDTIYAGNDPDLGLDFLNIEDDGTNPFGPDLRPDNGQDTVDGGEGDDLIFGGDDSDVLSGDEGNDTIDGGIDDDSLFGGTGDDSLIGGQGNDTISGDEGDDIIDGGIGEDDLSGGDDRDTFVNVNAGDVVDGGEGGDDFDVLDLTGSAGPDQEINIVYDPLNAENGTVEYKDQDGNVVDTLTFTNIENVIPCFTPGTLIATAKGERRVEELVAGDRIITRDNGIQAIRWAGAREMTGAEFEVSAHLKPILIQQGALGGGLPERDMMVSPQHRVLIANEKTSLYFEESEVLVAAKFLTALDGIDVVDVSATTYIHIMFDQHEVVLSDGAWTESFQPGDQTLAGIGDASRDEILEIFPELATRIGIDEYTSARRALKKHEAILLTK
jgi:Ca2+-binding RTX toxin-like protein